MQFRFGSWGILFVITALVVLMILLLSLVWFGWWVTNRHGTPCPYTGKPLKRGVDLAYGEVKELNDYLDKINSPENPPFSLRRASICPVTGRIFPNSVTIFEVIKVNWNFLKKRCPGNWVSYGSLTHEQKKQLAIYQPQIEVLGYQIEHSSTHPKPQDIEEKYARLSPGPLYVDLTTRALLGWKRVPGTIWEVLVVQPPFDEVRGTYDDIVIAKKPIERKRAKDKKQSKDGKKTP